MFVESIKFYQHFEALRGNPELDHDNNTHEYQGMFDIALF